MSATTEKRPIGNTKPMERKRPTKQQEMDLAYTQFGTLIRLSLGENPDFESALYDGDYTLSLEEAQRRKNAFICEQLGIGQGTRVLDLGCGWGGFLKYIEAKGAQGIGVNLSSGQIAACRRSGLNVHLKDARYITPSDFGLFDAIVAIGSFDHAATLDDYLNGLQDEVYASYFRHVAALLPTGRRFFLQSMVFSKNMIPYEAMDIRAPKDSNAYLMALLQKHFPNSWLPYGSAQIIRAAAPYFKVIHESSGRLDFIETNKQWKKRLLRFSFRKYLWFLSLAPKYLRDKEFRYQLELLKIRPNRVCFEREIMDQARLVFERI